MITLYQTIHHPGKGNCMQTTIASLLELPMDKVPYWKDLPLHEQQHALIKFVIDKGYDYHGTIYNPRLQAAEDYNWRINKDLAMPVDKFPDIQNMKGIKGYFFATVFSPTHFDLYSKKQINHAVVIDKNFNIVNPINEKYVGMKRFPLWWLIGYNGILSIHLFEEKF